VVANKWYCETVRQIKDHPFHELRNGGRLIRDSKQIALELNTFFVSSVEELVQQLNAEQQLKFCKHQSIIQYSPFSLQQINEAKVLEAANSVNNSYTVVRIFFT